MGCRAAGYGGNPDGPFLSDRRAIFSIPLELGALLPETPLKNALRAPRLLEVLSLPLSLAAVRDWVSDWLLC
jgi:hypothetical protein